MEEVTGDKENQMQALPMVILLMEEMTVEIEMREIKINHALSSGSPKGKQKTWLFSFKKKEIVVNRKYFEIINVRLVDVE